MKKISIILLSFTLFMSTYIGQAFASEKEDALEVVNALKDLGYQTEVGVNYRDYTTQQRKIYMKYRKYEDTYKDSKDIANKMYVTYMPYADASDIWIVNT